MSAITSAHLGAFIAALHQSIIRREQELNMADAKLGDGDTGSMLRRVLGAMDKVDMQDSASLSDAAKKFGAGRDEGNRIQPWHPGCHDGADTFEICKECG